MDNNSSKMGLMAILAVSASVAVVSMQAHNRLLSNFINQIQFQIKHSTVKDKGELKRKVGFADDDVAAPTAGAEKHRHKNGENLEAMPRNWQVMYKGILQHRNIRRYN